MTQIYGSICATRWQGLDKQIESSIFKHPASLRDIQYEEGSGGTEGKKIVTIKNSKNQHFVLKILSHFQKTVLNYSTHSRTVTFCVYCCVFAKTLLKYSWNVTLFWHVFCNSPGVNIGSEYSELKIISV